MFRLFLYTIILFLTGFIAIYALFNSDNMISIETMYFSFQTNIPFFLVLILCIVIVFSLIFILLYWFTGIPFRITKSKKKHLYKKSVTEVFDLLCDIDTESDNRSRMRKFNPEKTGKILNHPIVDLVDYKNSSCLQNKELHARALARVKNNASLGSLYYKEMILSKIQSEEYEDAKELLLEFAKRYSIRPVWYYKTAIFVFSHLGDVLRGKDIINRAKKAGAIEDNALELSNLYLNKAMLVEDKGDKEEMLGFLIDGFKCDFKNDEIVKCLYRNMQSLKGNRKILDLLKSAWIENANYEILEILFYLELAEDDDDLKNRIDTLLKKNNSDEAKLSLAKLAATKGLYEFSSEMLDKVYKKEEHPEYEKIYSFLQIVHLNDSNKTKLEILKKQIL